MKFCWPRRQERRLSKLRGWFEYTDQLIITHLLFTDSATLWKKYYSFGQGYVGDARKILKQPFQPIIERTPKVFPTAELRNRLDLLIKYVLARQLTLTR